MAEFRGVGLIKEGTDNREVTKADMGDGTILGEMHLQGLRDGTFYGGGNHLTLKGSDFLEVTDTDGDRAERNVKPTGVIDISKQSFKEAPAIEDAGFLIDKGTLKVFRGAALIMVEDVSGQTNDGVIGVDRPAGGRDVMRHAVMEFNANDRRNGLALLKDVVLVFGMILKSDVPAKFCLGLTDDFLFALEAELIAEGFGAAQEPSFFVLPEEIEIGGDNKGILDVA